ncbi:MAG TPA: hypothetical protein VFM18_21930 [Methanosarcina sp.]|nr:hypothetical protein [Methanosarcina sp.]
MKINIEWMYDDHDCDTCGSSFAEGALVTFEDGRVLELFPYANCYNSISFDKDEVYSRIIEELGHEIA